ncbi:MAG: polyprenyl synthetase family protein [Candidatus Nanopelagicales bacterium]
MNKSKESGESKFLKSLEIRPRIQNCLDSFISEQRPILNQVSKSLDELANFTNEFLSGGKRLRAAFCYWSFIGSGGIDSEEIIKAASSLEFLQACALIHDDVMDASDTRRGKPSIHKKFEQMHSSNKWLGESKQFGIGGAILLGDLVLSWADELLMNSGIAPNDLLRGKKIYDLMRTELMAGQYLDIFEQARGGGSLENAFNVIRYKSAKYTIERPLHLGCALATDDKNLMQVFSQFGLPLGEAFQLRDDVLGVFGDPEETGKPAGDDLREGKRTVLIEMTYANASQTQKQKLDQLFGKDINVEEVSALREIVTETKALEQVEKMINDRFDQSNKAISMANITNPAKEALSELALAATSRRV